MQLESNSRNKRSIKKNNSDRILPTALKICLGLFAGFSALVVVEKLIFGYCLRIAENNTSN